MNTFNERELTVIAKLKTQPAQTVLRINEPCPLHSACTPLPLFRVYKIDDESFEAEWNDFHRPGPRQVFRLTDAG